MKGWRSDVTTKATSIEKSFTEAMKSTDVIEKRWDGIISNLRDAMRDMKNVLLQTAQTLKAATLDEQRYAMKLDFSKENMTKLESRQDKREERITEKEIEKKDKEIEIMEKQAARQEKREAAQEAREEKQALQQEKKTNSEIRKNESDVRRNNAQVRKIEDELEERQLKRQQLKVRMSEQLKFIDEARAQAATRADRDMSTLEKKTLEYQEAAARVEEQRNSTLRGRVVSHQAILKATEAERQKQLELNREIIKQATGYDRVKNSTKDIVDNLNKMSTMLQRFSSSMGSLNSMFNQMRSWATGIGNALVRVGQTGLRYATQAARTMVSTATEQYSKLETAQIGFENFFGKEEAQKLTPRIQQEAINAPGLNSGDLADYVRQIAPVSNHNADLALNASLGMLKTIQYGGAEGSEEMEYVIKNIRDVISKGQATAIDLRQFNRAMPIFEEVLGSIGKSEFLKDGKLNITKENAGELLQAFAEINTDPNSPVADIYEKLGNTLEGLKEAIKEQFTTGLNNTLVDLGVYEKVKNLLKEIKDNGVLDQMFTWIGNVANKIIDTVSNLDWKSIKEGTITSFTNVWNSLKKAAKQIMDVLGASDLSGLIIKISELVGKFIEGFGNGVSKVLDIINQFKDQLGSDVLQKAAEFLGTLASPLGLLISAVGKFAQNLIYFGSRATSILGQTIQWFSDNKLGKIDEMMKSPTTMAQHKTFLDATTQGMANGTVKFGSPDVQNVYSNLKKDQAVYQNTANQTIGIYNNKTGSWQTVGYGKYYNSSTKKMKRGMGLRQRLQLYSGNADAIDGAIGGFEGFTSAAKGAINKATSAIKSNMGKAMNAMAIASVGNAVSTIAGQIVANVSGSQDMGSIVSNLGSVLSNAIAVGTQFGLLPGAIAGAITAFGELVQASNEYVEAEQERIKTTMEAALTHKEQNFMNTAVYNLKQLGIYTEYEDATEDAYEEMLKNSSSIISSTENPEEAIRKLMETYTNRYYGTKVNENINKFGEQWKEEHPNGDAGTTITNKNDPAVREALIGIYKNLRATGQIKDASLSFSNKDFETAATGEEIWNYLEDNGVDVKSLEFLTAVQEKMNEQVSMFNQGIESTKNADLVLTLDDGETKYSTAEDYMENALHMEWDGEKWRTKSEMEMIIKYGKEIAENPQDERYKDDIMYKDAHELLTKGDFWGSLGMSLGAGIQNIINSMKYGFAGHSNGGNIRPIYRSGGGDARGVDTVPAMLQPGEFVVRKSAVDKIGVGTLTSLNYGDISRAASMLGSHMNKSINNSRVFRTNNYNGHKTINNFVNVVNRNSSATASTYYGLANRLAMGF